MCVCVGGGGGVGYLSPYSQKKNRHFPLFPHNLIILFSVFPVPQNCICSPVPFSFRLLFPCSPEINGPPCSPEINGLILLFPKTTGLKNTDNFDRPHPIKEMLSFESDPEKIPAKYLQKIVTPLLPSKIQILNPKK